MSAMIISRRSIEELHSPEYNPRIDILQNPGFRKALSKSIDRFGYVEPIVWNKRTGNVVGGNQRLAILKEKGITEVEVVEVDMPEAEEKALNIALNKVVGDWHQERLSALMRDLQQLDPTLLDFTGFDGKELDRVLKDRTKMLGKDVDSIPEAPEPITRPGDLIILGDHRLLCGDSTQRDDVAKLMNGQRATMIFTDPPYNVNYGSTKNPKYGSSITNDNLSAEDWLEFNRQVFTSFREFCDGDIYMWGASGPDGMAARKLLVDMGCHWSATIVWVKDRIVLSPANYHRQYEPCFYGWFERSSFNNAMNSGNDRAGLSDVWNVARPNSSELHPTMKPVELCETGIGLSSKPGDIVLDLFGGSGSTMIACERMDRACYMMELEPHYCDVIVKRWEDLTGRQAVRQ